MNWLNDLMNEEWHEYWTDEKIEKEMSDHGLDEFPKLESVVVKMVKKYRRFGLADPMYIANVLAVEMGLGDGHDHFDTDLNKDIDKEGIEKAVNRLTSHAYPGILKAGEMRDAIGEAMKDMVEKSIKEDASDYFKDIEESESAGDKISLTLELPSGVTLNQKISANSKDWIKEFKEQVDAGEKPGEQIKDMENRIKQNIKNLVDKVAVVITYQGEKHWSGK